MKAWISPSPLGGEKKKNQTTVKNARFTSKTLPLTRKTSYSLQGLHYSNSIYTEKVAAVYLRSGSCEF